MKTKLILAVCLADIEAMLEEHGFHLDNRLLEPRGLLPRKGAPETFDFGGFGVLVMHHLHQGHARHRVEEVQADQPFGPLQHRSDLRQRDGRSVGGEDSVRLDARLEVLEQFLLGFEVLEYGFDDDVRARRAGAFHISGQPA